MWRLLLSLFQGPGAERPPSTGFQSAPATLPAAEGNGGRVSRSDTLPEGFDLLETPAGPRLRAAVDHPTSEIIGGVIFSSMMFRWATAAVPESTFEHVETLQVDNYIDAGDTQFLHTGSRARMHSSRSRPDCRFPIPPRPQSKPFRSRAPTSRSSART